MKVAPLINTYVASKRSLGMRYRSQAAVLNAFARSVGDLDIREVTPDMALTFIAGKGAVTTAWQKRFEALNGLYRFAICRGLVALSPLPSIRPKIPPSRTPYIYSTDEIRRLLSATALLATSNDRLKATTFRMLLLLLYSSGLRISEALSLTLQDVSLTECALTVRHEVL
jgi:integrase/recombinase XerD